MPGILIVALLLAMSPLVLAGVSDPAASAPSARLDPEVVGTMIRQEEEQHSQIMRTLHFLTDVHGPRLTGSPSLKAAGEWAIATMTSWGFANGHLEPWDFGHAGWTNEYFSAHLVSPVKTHLVAEPLAWTPGTKGPLVAEAFNLLLPEGPLMPDPLQAYLNTVKDQVTGKIILAGKPAFVPVSFTHAPGRLSDEDARRRFGPEAADAGQVGGARAPATGNRGQGNQPAGSSGTLNAPQIDRAVNEFLMANGAVARINDAGRPYGLILATSNRNYEPDRALPTAVMRNEDYGRVARLLADGTRVTLELNIVNTMHPEGRTAYNAIAEIPGTDKKDEIIMLGGHLDSWHSGTGATDNAIGCATMMEAARILKAIGAEPRRTIRVALWSGEEEGLLGSLAYVKVHFGSFESPTPEFARLDAYLNIDSGTGRARGATVFGPPEAAAVVRQALAPFHDLGVIGAVATRSRAVRGTDSTSFNNAGLPGIGFGQDPIDYNSHTHHTNLDHYERVIEADVKTSAIAIAATLYDLAMRDQMLPRFGKADIPPPAPARTAPE